MIAILILIATNVFTGVAALVFWVKAKERDDWKRAHDLVASDIDRLLKAVKDLLSKIDEQDQGRP